MTVNDGKLKLFSSWHYYNAKFDLQFSSNVSVQMLFIANGN